MAFIACKLPQGLTVRHHGKEIVLRGQNAAFDADNPSPLGKMQGDHRGFGITEVSDDDATTFADWKKAVTFKDDGKTKVAEPFLPLENGSLIGPFSSEDEAKKEIAKAEDVDNGMGGVDPKKDLPVGVETDDEAMGNGKK